MISTDCMGTVGGPALESMPAPSSPESVNTFHWTPAKVVLSLFLFFAAGICEIGGGWLVWQAIREHRPWWWAILGSVVLVGYGVVPTAQPTSSFGRVYAVYGGVFIVLSYLWGWLLDGDKPDIGKVSLFSEVQGLVFFGW